LLSAFVAFEHDAAPAGSEADRLSPNVFDLVIGLQYIGDDPETSS